jgi:predicted phage baseplate assembly protein
MTRLAPNLFERRYSDLVQLGRSRLPSYAPAWTDHNVHDPGITLIELLAWLAEAQLYSLSRTRRDERRAYAALVGVEPHGPRPARGLIWPDHDDPESPATAVTRGLIIEAGTVAALTKNETPEFRARHRQVWIPARIDGLDTRLANGSLINQLPANQRGGPAFQPFGPDEGRDAVLRMSLAATGRSPLFEPERPKDARLIIGVRADQGTAGSDETDAAFAASPVEVTFVADGERVRLPVKEDSTGGMLRTGALVLDVSAVETTPASALLEFRAPSGFERAPRLIRIEPNVIPIIQRREVTTEFQSVGTRLPDQAFDLDTPGLEFEPGSDPVRVEILQGGAFERWLKTDRLDDCGPDDKNFELDTVAARISFGNGVNGAILPANTTGRATYSVNDGQAGNIAANRKWVVRGFDSPFGVNPDPTFGGEDASGWLEQRRDARRAIRMSHPLVSASDFEEAAKLLPGMEVGRAWLVPPSDGDLATGTMRLIAMRARQTTVETGGIPETPRWLASIRERLTSRLPLGSRLLVVAPRYVEFTIATTLEAEPRKDPQDVCRNASAELTQRLALVAGSQGALQRPFGLPVSRRDLVAWLQHLPDVRLVRELTIRVPGRGSVETVDVPKSGLPRFDLQHSTIEAVRSGGGAS